ncbi:hypothetical protein FKC81_28310, partial [Klebsiella pneumoniae]
SFANYNNLLPYKELVSTAKSIAKFCWKEFSNEKLHDIQSKKQKLHTKTLLEKAIMINEE